MYMKKLSGSSVFGESPYYKSYSNTSFTTGEQPATYPKSLATVTGLRYYKYADLPGGDGDYIIRLYYKYYGYDDNLSVCMYLKIWGALTSGSHYYFKSNTGYMAISYSNASKFISTNIANLSGSPYDSTNEFYVDIIKVDPTKLSYTFTPGTSGNTGSISSTRASIDIHKYALDTIPSPTTGKYVYALGAYRSYSAIAGTDVYQGTTKVRYETKQYIIDIDRLTDISLYKVRADNVGNTDNINIEGSANISGDLSCNKITTDTINDVKIHNDENYIVLQASKYSNSCGIVVKGYGNTTTRRAYNKKFQIFRGTADLFFDNFTDTPLFGTQDGSHTAIGGFYFRNNSTILAYITPGGDVSATGSVNAGGDMSCNKLILTNNSTIFHAGSSLLLCSGGTSVSMVNANNSAYVEVLASKFTASGSVSAYGDGAQFILGGTSSSPQALSITWNKGGTGRSAFINAKGLGSGGFDFYNGDGTNYSHISSITQTGAYYTNSDDRLKEEETYITNALDTINKIKPEVYKKKASLNDTNENDWFKESGVIAQQIWYEVPELRHLVNLGSNANPVELDNGGRATSLDDDNDPNIDLDYTALGWGDSPSSVNYCGFIPYLIQSVKELAQQNEDLTKQNNAMSDRLSYLEKSML